MMGKDRAGLNRSVINNQDASDPHSLNFGSHTLMLVLLLLSPLKCYLRLEPKLKFSLPQV